MRFRMCRRFRREVPQYLVPSTGQNKHGSIYRYPIQVLGEQILVETPLVGRHQLRNLALAIAAAVELNQQGFGSITAKSIETRYPTRRDGRDGFR